jgi:hypothetical protein
MTVAVSTRRRVPRHTHEHLGVRDDLLIPPRRSQAAESSFEPTRLVNRIVVVSGSTRLRRRGHAEVRANPHQSLLHPQASPPRPYVFIVGFNNNFFPRDPDAITDDEVCKLLVALSRTRVGCHVFSCRHFGPSWLDDSIFTDWIRPHLDLIEVDKHYFAS